MLWHPKGFIHKCKTLGNVCKDTIKQINTERSAFQVRDQPYPNEITISDLIEHIILLQGTVVYFPFLLEWFNTAGSTGRFLWMDQQDRRFVCWNAVWVWEKGKRKILAYRDIL